MHLVEIEQGDNFCSIYVPRCPETKSLIRALTILRAPTADYWSDWNDYIKTQFTTDLKHYKKDRCIGHSWTFGAVSMVDRLKKLVGTLPVQNRTTHEV